ncbi:MAG TPA: (Fe-S)-binding protein, partial [Candidatus Acidoferrales bacterium]|nr:(Fe-S)-binding protein [Candidatus Acidoferrales bacterium]
WLFETLMFPARVLQGIPALLKGVQALPLPTSARRLARMIPRGQSTSPPYGNIARKGDASGRASRPRVGLFLGCVMRSLFSGVHRATMAVLERHGFDVVVPQGQWCCGALNVHAGERTQARIMATRNVDAFGGAQVDCIVVNSAGCGAMLKEYRELLGDDDRTRSFCAKVKDVNELLGETQAQTGLGSLPGRVTYHDACHLAHGQRIRRQPRELLKRIPGLEYVELQGADECCGAAGVYSLTHPHLSAAILEKKLDAVEASRADVVATANPGCAMQLQAGLLERRSTTRVCHPVELLAESYSAGLRTRPT